MCTKDGLKRILGSVLEARTSTCGQDWGTFEDLSEQALKPKSPDVYKGKLHIDSYNFIQQYKDYFATFECQSRNQVLFVATFFKKSLELMAIIQAEDRSQNLGTFYLG